MRRDLPLRTVAAFDHTRRRRRYQRLDKKARAGILFVSPALLFFLVFFLGPLCFAVYVSLHDWDMLSPITSMPFVGLDQYQELLTADPLFKKTLVNSFAFALGNLVFLPPLSLAVALLLNSGVHWLSLWRTIFFTPVVTSAVAVAIIWAYIFDPTYGPLNALLVNLHLPPQSFLSSETEAMPCIILVSVWQSLGYYAIIYLAGLQGIAQEHLDAARVDGASRSQTFRYITLPLLNPTTLFVLVIITINALQVFTPVFIMTNGGPVDSTRVVVLNVYDTAFTFLHMGKASAMAMILFAIIFVFSLGEVKLMERGR
ncbi:MAG: sugar ABC transporter permease [Chloroflexi bacterium]|nr:sugar ABC transporter permease [Chloroflexota bacterium]